MKVMKTVTAGTLESSDIMVTLSPGVGLQIQLESTVKSIYGDVVTATITKTLTDFGVTDASVFARDSGATDPVIMARVETAVKRAMREEKQ